MRKLLEKTKIVDCMIPPSSSNYPMIDLIDFRHCFRKQRRSLNLIFYSQMLLITGILFVLSLFLFLQLSWVIRKKAYRDISIASLPDKPMKILYVITPTHHTVTRMADMTRLVQTFQNIPNLKWIVVEDDEDIDQEVYELLKRKEKSWNLDFVYVAVPTDTRDRCRGNTHRNVGLQWILDRVWEDNRGLHWTTDHLSKNHRSQNLSFEKARYGRDFSIMPQPNRVKMAEPDKYHWRPFQQQQQSDLEGIVYFADDDNTYDSDLFEELRKINTIGLFPVGLVTGTTLSTPIVDLRTGQFIGFYDGWLGSRAWPLDMAGFAVSLNYMYEINQDKNYWFFPLCYYGGYSENNFLIRFGLPQNTKVDVLAHNATKVLVWHTKTVKVKRGYAINMSITSDTNLMELKEKRLTA